MASPHISIQVESKPSKYPAKQHARRVAAKLEQKHGLIYLPGQNAANLEDSDMPKTWRQRRYFYYCSGVDVPDASLTYDIAKDVLALYIAPIKWDRVLWSGRGPTIEEAQDEYDCDAVHLSTSLAHHIERWRRRNPASTLYVLHGSQTPPISSSSNIDKDSLQHAIDLCRAIKDPHELVLLRHANAVSAKAHTAILQNIHRFHNESQIEGLFKDVSVSHFCKQAYNVIAGSGANAGVLHYDSNNEQLKGRQLVCLDAGAEFENYASDVTRTFPLSGKWSKEADEIYEVVREMQESCIQALRPGVKMLDLHVMCHRMVVQGLLRLGILKNGSAEEILKAGTSVGFYPHGLGHHMGLDCHDCQTVPVLRYKESNNRLYEAEMCSALCLEAATLRAPCTMDAPPLEPGMVITIEPGIYFNKDELKRNYLSSPKHAKYIDEEVLDRYWAVGGVRIEDDLVITKDGYENLTTAPKGEEALGIIRKSMKELE